MSHVCRALAVPALACVLTLAVAHVARAQPAIMVSSTADALSASFTANGLGTVLPPVAPITGSAPPSYSKSVSLASYSKTLNIAYQSGAAVTPAFFVTMTGLTDHVSGSALGIDSYGASGNTSATAAELSLNLNPPPPSGPVPLPPLTIVAKGVTAGASYSVVVPEGPSVYGTATFTSLQVSGSLVGDRTLKYAGTPPANYVLFSSPQMTITLNHQIAVSDVVCMPNGVCTVTPFSITEAAVFVTLANASIFGRLVSGSFALGDTVAD